MIAEVKRSHKNAEFVYTFLPENPKKLPEELREFDLQFETAIKSKQFDGKYKSEVFLHGTGPIKQLLVLGLGDKKSITLEIFRELSGIAGKWVKKIQCKEPAVFLPEIPKGLNEHEIAIAVSEALVMATYSFDFLKTSSETEAFSIEKLIWVSNEKSVEPDVNKGLILANAVNETRDLSLLPGNHLTPSIFAERAISMANKTGLKCTILNETDMEKENMGALLSVSKGSDEEAKMIILEHNPIKNNTDETIVFVGKGLTFDAGGISIKPSLNMHEMKMDMCGGAAVFGAMRAVAELNLPIRVIGIIPSSENLINGKANKPGDVVTSKNGKTIEILNTDAEGRLILCDALTYAERFEPDAVIDAATLTGAMVVSLGNHVTGMMGNNEALLDELSEAGEHCFERVWELPLYDEYAEQLKSEIADLANIGGKEAGSITAGAFLSKFTEKYHWAHLDIAGTAWSHGKKSYIPKGASGVGVRLFIQFLENRIK